MVTVARLYREAFSGLPRAVWVLALGLLVNRAGTMVLPFLTLYLVEQRGLGPGNAKAALFAFGLGSVAGVYLGGRLADRLGSVRVQRLALIAAGAAFLAVSRLHGIGALMAGLFLLNVFNDAYRPAVMAATVEHAPPALQVRALALIRLAANLGMAIGPAVGGLLASIDYLWLFVGNALTCWLAAGVLTVALGDAKPAAPPAGAPSLGWRAWRDGRLMALLAIVFVLAMVLFQVFNTVPLYLSSHLGLDERDIGLLFALNAGLIVAFEMVLVRLLEHREPARLLGIGGFLLCAGFAVFPLGRGLGIAVTAFVVLTLGEMLALPFSNGLVAKLAGNRGVGEYMAWYGMAFSAAFVLAPVVGLTLLDRLGPTALWLAIGCAGPAVWAGSVALARRLREERPAQST